MIYDHSLSCTKMTLLPWVKCDRPVCQSHFSNSTFLLITIRGNYPVSEQNPFKDTSCPSSKWHWRWLFPLRTPSHVNAARSEVASDVSGETPFKVENKVRQLSRKRNLLNWTNLSCSAEPWSQGNLFLEWAKATLTLLWKRSTRSCKIHSGDIKGVIYQNHMLSVE